VGSVGTIVELYAVQDQAVAVNRITVEGRLGWTRGRNFAVDVLEYFDSVRFTRCKGEARINLNRTLPDRLFTA
jgi:hypothetical protein